MFVDDSPLSRAIRMCYNLRNRGANLAAMSRLFETSYAAASMVTPTPVLGVMDLIINLAVFT